MSSKRGRPARQMNEEKIINLLMDVYRNPEYFQKLFEYLSYEEEKFFTESFENLHTKLSESTASKSKILTSHSESEKRIEQLKDSENSESEIEKIRANVPVLKDHDIKEFQSVIDKIPSDLWKRYNNRLRQKSYKQNNRWSKQIEFSENAYFELSYLKKLLNSKSWNDFPFSLAKDYKKIDNICDALQVNSLDAAMLKINEMLLLQRSK